MTRLLLIASLLALGACAGVDTNDICRDASNCSPQCGTVAGGAQPGCDPIQREGRTRG